MENHFYRNYCNYHPQRPRFASMDVPMHQRTVPVVPKVVPIPVRFVESKKNSMSDSATKIQKAFRGFLVRKNVKKVLAIEREVNEIERMLSIEETIDSIRRDMKERVKLGEMLMNLLFRLDSVKGVDAGIRNLRKAVIKKAIALQEKIDSITATNSTPKSDSTEFDSTDRSLDGTPEAKIVSSSAEIHIPNTCDSKIETADDRTELVESNLHSIVPEVSSGCNNLTESRICGEEDEQRIDVLERMMIENKRMMEMMGQLFERNEKQTQILCSLSHRVEQLEKAFVYETLRRMKKSSAIVDTSEKCSKAKKCDNIMINLPVVEL